MGHGVLCLDIPDALLYTSGFCFVPGPHDYFHCILHYCDECDRNLYCDESLQIGINPTVLYTITAPISTHGQKEIWQLPLVPFLWRMLTNLIDIEMQSVTIRAESTDHHVIARRPSGRRGNLLVPFTDLHRRNKLCTGRLPRQSAD